MEATINLSRAIGLKEKDNKTKQNKSKTQTENEKSTK